MWKNGESNLVPLIRVHGSLPLHHTDTRGWKPPSEKDYLRLWSDSPVGLALEWPRANSMGPVLMGKSAQQSEATMGPLQSKEGALQKGGPFLLEQSQTSPSVFEQLAEWSRSTPSNGSSWLPSE